MNCKIDASVDMCRYVCMHAWRTVLIQKHVELSGLIFYKISGILWCFAQQLFIPIPKFPISLVQSTSIWVLPPGLPKVPLPIASSDLNLSKNNLYVFSIHEFLKCIINNIRYVLCWCKKAQRVINIITLSREPQEKRADCYCTL